MRWHTAGVCGALACVAVLLHAPATATVQGPTHEHQQSAGTPQQEMMARCQAVMAEHDKLMAEMKAADEHLDSLVAKMNAASGQEKTDAIAAVATELVAQRKTMRDRMMSMQQHMMGHMAEHMHAGPQSMSMCPMMKMGGMKQ